VSEPDPVQMSQQRMDGGRVRTGRPAHGVSDPDHPGADGATAQWFLHAGPFRHGEPSDREVARGTLPAASSAASAARPASSANTAG
jgi:hypothetical protein